MTYYFLTDDLKALDATIATVQAQMRKAGAEMGRSCEEGAETYHDNFAYEEGDRQLWMLSHRLRDLLKVRNGALVVTPGCVVDAVQLGTRVTIVDEEGREQRIRIGSYLVLGDGPEKTISYTSPLGRLLVGAQVGEVREGAYGGRSHAFTVAAVA